MDSQPQPFTMKEMFKTSYKSEQVFGIKEYKMPVQYVKFNKDSIGQIGNYSLSPRKNPTKKPPWINLNLKDAAKIPSPSKYAVQRKWPFKDRSDNIQNRPDFKNNVKNKNFVDIQVKQKQHIPPPNKYDTRVTDFTPKEKIFNYRVLPDPSLRREFYVDDVLHVANKTPGPGQYNPYKEVKKIKVNTKDYKYWIEKHKSQSASPKKGGKNGKEGHFTPDMCSYSPIPTQYDTFARTWAYKDKFKKADKNFLKNKDKKKENAQFPHTGFGLEKRFKDTSKEKQKRQNNSPGPQCHNNISYWPGKNDVPGGEFLNRPVLNQISKGPDINMYYSK